MTGVMITTTHGYKEVFVDGYQPIKNPVMVSGAELDWLNALIDRLYAHLDTEAEDEEWVDVGQLMSPVHPGAWRDWVGKGRDQT